MRELTNNEGILGYAIYSHDAIPIKYNKLEYNQVVQYGALISDLLFRAKTNIERLRLKDGDSNLQTIRIRTARDTELIISNVENFFMLVIQQCEGKTTRADLGQEGEEEKETS